MSAMIRRHSHLRPALAGALLALVATGCASDADLSSLRREQRDLARKLADTRADVESMRVQLSRLRGQIEDSGRARATPPPPVSEPMSGSAAASSDIEERLRALESTRSGEPVAGVRPGSVPPGWESGAPSQPPGPPPMPEGGSPVSVEADLNRSESTEYRTGLTQYQRGEPQKAVQTLRGFVNKNPKVEVAPYAQYWIGESYYSQGKFNESILAYNEILVGFPKSDRVPAALLRQASAFAELGDKIDARLILQKLIAEHPQSPEAARAKRQLLALGN